VAKAETRRKKRFRPIRWLQRAILGAMMTFVAFVVEKRLLKALKKEGTPLKGEEEGADAQDLGADVTTGYDRSTHQKNR
jgi:hypothetical protein